MKRAKNMKKLIGFMLSLAMLSSLPASAAFAVDYSNNSILPLVKDTVSETSTTDLKALASSLGADTDYFNFPNYNVEIPEKDILSAFMRNISQTEAILNVPRTAKNTVGNAGGCHGFSIIQILTHNGVIPVSAIQSGAETLHDVQFNKSVNDIIAYYQMTQEYMRQDNIISYAYCNNTTEQQLAHLIETAEKAMNSNRYFYIAFNLKEGVHAVAGIGVADGEWTFNDKTYNKCVLTLDSNSIKDDGSGGGFNRRTCIYINTADNSFCIPGYEADETNTSFRAVIDDDNILNYKGLINPASDKDVPATDIVSSWLIDPAESEFELTLIRDGKSETLHGTQDSFMPTSHMFFQGLMSRKHFFIKKADHYKFDTLSIADDDFDTNRTLRFDTETSTQTIIACGDFSAEAKENFLSVTSRSDFPSITLDLSSENGLYKNSRFCEYGVWGNCPGRVSIEETADGIFVRHDNPLDAQISFEGIITQDDGSLIVYPEDDTPLNFLYYEIYSVADNLWKYDEETDDMVCYADPDGDEVFDTKVVDGDVNCDGVIDAADASKILEIYGKLSSDVEVNPYITSKRYADYNNDGVINASDASAVLAKYAEISSNKK